MEDAIANDQGSKAEGKSKSRWQSISLDNKYILLGIVLGIIVLLIYLRTGLLQYQGLFEPDGFFYYTALKQIVAQGYPLVTPNTQVLLAGYPWHYRLNEAPGIMYFTLVPYLFMSLFGVSLLDVMRVVPIIFGILEAIAAYFLVRYLANSRALGLLAMFFVATSSGNIARTAGAVYRGDTFITLFVMIVLLLVLKVLTEKDDKKRYIYLGVAIFIASAGNLVWNGGVIVPMMYLLSVTLVAIYGFAAADRSALKNCTLLLFGGIIAWVLNQAYLIAGLINGSLFTPPSFFGILIPIVVGTVIAKYLIDNKDGFKEGSPLKAMTSTFSRRLITLIAVAVVVGLVVMLAFNSYVVSLLTNGGSIYQQNTIANTTQELQPPTYTFIWASFALQVYLAPIGVLLYLLFAHMGSHTPHGHLKRGRLRANVSYGFIVLLAYLLVTAYLQNGAIRYNSVLSIPLALFSAYAVYIIYKVLSRYSMVLSGTEIRFVYIYSGVMVALLLMQIVFTQAQSLSSVQADGINPVFLQAMTWASQNTQKNATFDDLWPDGSVVEGWGNRTSFQDSVGGENGTRIVAFGGFLFNTSTDAPYLIGKAFKPQYILIRNFWYNELGGIAEEANLTSNLSLYGYQAMTGFNIGGNSTEQVYQFSSSTYVVQMLIKPLGNGTRSIIALLSPVGTNQAQQLAHIVFLNDSNYAYSIIDANSSKTLNFTLLVEFQGRNITGAALIGQTLAYTNMFKLLEECGYSYCAYGDSNITATLAYGNADSKIIKLTYH